MTTFLLPCACSARIEVGPGQAGGQVVCPACGTRLDVPTLRGLRDLEAAPARSPVAAGRWDWRHASLLAGLTTAAVACSAAAALIGMANRPLIDPEMIRGAAMAADDRSIIEAWRVMSGSGVARAPTPEEASLQRIVLLRRRVAAGLAAIGGLGAVAALAGGSAILLQRKAGR